MTTSQSTPRIEPRLQEARELYRRLISREVEEANLDKLIAIDRESEDFEIGEDVIEIVRRLKARRPDANVVGFRVCDRGGAVDRIGSYRVSACLK